MRRTVAAMLAAASAFLAAPATADASTCVPVNRYTGACAFGDGWLVCAYDRSTLPYLYVYLPDDGSSDREPCGTW